MKTTDLLVELEQFKGLWVALTDSDEVISSNKSAQQVCSEAIKKAIKKLCSSKCQSMIYPTLA